MKGYGTINEKTQPIPTITEQKVAFAETKYVSEAPPNAFITLTLLSLGCFLMNLCDALTGPILPIEIEEKGLSYTSYGFIAGTFSLTIFLCAPALGHLINVISPSFLFQAGIIIVSSCTILMGSMHFISDPRSFLIWALIIRGVQGTGVAAVNTSAFAIVSEVYPKNIAGAFSFLKAVLYVGSLTGPVIAGALFEYGGFHLPFFTMGGVMFVAGILNLLLFPRSIEVHQEEVSVKSLLKFWLHPSVFLESLALLRVAIYINVNQASLEPNLRQFHLHPTEVGIIYVVSYIVGAVVSPIWGWIVDRMVRIKPFYLLTSIDLIFYLLFIGPLPYLPYEQTLAGYVLCFMLLGIGHSSAVVSCYAGVVRDAIKRGFPNDVTTYGLGSSLYISMVSLGGFIGPVYAGAFMDTYGFAYGTVPLFFAEVGVMLTVIVYIVVEYFSWKRSSNTTQDEQKTLVPNL